MLEPCQFAPNLLILLVWPIETCHLVVGNKLRSAFEPKVHARTASQRCCHRAGNVSALEKSACSAANQKGHSPCFSAGDLLAIAVVRVLSIHFEIRIGALGPLGDELFSLCNSAPWPTLERGHLVIDVPGATIQFQAEPGALPTKAPALFVPPDTQPAPKMPLHPVIAELRDQLLAEGGPEKQATLRFPPTPLASTTERDLARTRP